MTDWPAKQSEKYFLLPSNPSLSSHSSRCPTQKVHLECDDVSFGEWNIIIFSWSRPQVGLAGGSHFLLSHFKLKYYFAPNVRWGSSVFSLLLGRKALQ